MKTKDYDIYRKSFPYYKVQYYDDIVRAWKDIQKRFTYPDDAFASLFGRAGLYRVIEVTREGRHLYGG